ncbi:MAG: hypothetical protein K2M36_05730 [Clostridia bacterium]|nr:hypothetical protein [Clostridia bacterium]
MKVYTDGVERIHFDGRGNVGGGNVTFSVGGTDKTYGYELVQDGYVVNILDGEDIVYTLDVATMTLKKDGQTVGVLGVYHDILGRVYSVNGTEGNVFELDCSNLFDADGIATGKWNTTSVVYSYVSQNTIAVYDSNMSSAVFYLVYVDENTVIIANVSSSGTLEAYSIAFIPDELIGTYYNADNSEKLIIDGSSKNSYMLSSAVFFEIDEDGEQTSDEVRYTYFKENGVWGIYSYNKVDYEFEYTLVYTVSLQEVDGAVAYTTADKSKTVWIKQA